MAIKIRKEDALNYHTQGSPGKIEVIPSKPLSSQMDLALAYSPGVAEPCKEIEADVENVYKYTAKGNLVAVISNGTAVLGLGDIGPEASKPVMEGKGVLFKKFAGIDVFDIEINEKDPKKLIEIIRSLEPTFGGVNLEDIKAPECFEIEQTLKREMNIPVMHDDQHGTAIISGAALLNALEIVEKDISEIKLVVNGAGASAVSCTRFYMSLGVKRENLVMCDKEGVIRQDRPELDDIKKEFATHRDLRTLSDALAGADVFLGLSAGNIVSQDQIKLMAANPIVFALANPDPEIAYDLAIEAREDVIMATGRSDHPNQVNNVLGFPYIFRGALDVRSTAINEEMKLAAAKAIAKLAKEPVPDIVNKAYGESKLGFGRFYLIPKPLDPRLITTIAPAVAKAAMDSGVAKNPIKDWAAYELELQERIGIDQRLMSVVISRAKKDPKKVVFAEADNRKILKAAQIIRDEKIANPILLGNRAKILTLIEENSLDLQNVTIIDPLEESEKLSQFADILYKKRQRKGMTLADASRLVTQRNYFGAMMVETGLADAFISGLTRDYPKTILPSLHTIGVKDKTKRVAGMYIMNTDKGPYFFADATVNLNPTAEELVEIIGLTADAVRFFNIEPRVAVLSYSNFGSAKGEIAEKMAKATAMAKQRFPGLIIEGEMQANVALNEEIQRDVYPFSQLINKKANTLIFPDLGSGNIAYKLLAELGNAEAIGPILLGMNKPVHILQLGSSIREIVNMVAIAVVDAQIAGRP
ncbi:MAG TPA: NADP-dependent malic enzyme [Algoriphagus sp.]|jgi:malate dehydrogenase (oxaloacetate-decarboxylating)(NADP+)|uniref:NADP-dependent malic enzyme n=2 Tax=Cyclobacteriaceae TaxID=563798 RepID=UPI000C4C58FC|nr:MULTISPECIES: NADP-dependent malic enzyme [Algoriphagus]MAL13006.1 NADP-dependent malic enzyme [Algoriphagus sp.]QYH39363.1 NADP-dependent malic enzyme [Algoriphagus sp. NBT04N3]HCD89962.1 NADP-dependent malic enzyme [Algoriphagus sp.]|tara:strand:- start:10326 stop:12596 length:2271 start_codon:yes stop_codon:yes gene_type:complete